MAFAKGTVYAVNGRLDALEKFATEQERENKFLRAELEKLRLEYVLVLTAESKNQDYVEFLRKKVAERLAARQQ
jgi:hypothetical protein